MLFMIKEVNMIDFEKDIFKIENTKEEFPENLLKIKEPPNLLYAMRKY